MAFSSTIARSWLASRFKNERAIPLLLIAIVVLIWIPRLDGPIDLRWDAGVYYILGTSIAQGEGYRLLNEPEEIEAVQYPPLLPLIVAAHQWLLGTSDFLVVGQWLRVFYFFLYIGVSVSVYWLARLYLTPGYAFLAAFVCILDLNMYYLSNLLFTEIPFTLLTTLFVIWNQKSEKFGYAMLTAVAGVATYFLRTAGIALLAAWVVESFLHRRFKQMAVRALVALIPILIWQAHISEVKYSQEYRQPAYEYQRAPYQQHNVTYLENISLINPFSPELGQVTAEEMIRRIAMNVIAIPAALGEALSAPIWLWTLSLREASKLPGFPLLPMWLGDIPLLLFASLVIAGMILLAARGKWFIPLYFASSVVLILLTPFQGQFTRYFTPLAPFLILSLFYALACVQERCIRWFVGPWKKAGPLLSILVISIIFLVEGASLAALYSKRRYAVSYYDAHGNEAVHHLFFYFPPWKALDASLEWLRQRSKSDEVIATTVPHWAFLRIGRKAVSPPMVVGSENVQRLLDSVPVKYVVVDELHSPGISQRYLAPAIEKLPDFWKLVYVAPEGKSQIYERIK